MLVGRSRELVWGVKREGGLSGLRVWEWGCRGEAVPICDFGGRVCRCEEFWEGEMEQGGSQRQGHYHSHGQHMPSPSQESLTLGNVPPPPTFGAGSLDPARAAAAAAQPLLRHAVSATPGLVPTPSLHSHSRQGHDHVEHHSDGGEDLGFFRVALIRSRSTVASYGFAAGPLWSGAEIKKNRVH